MILFLLGASGVHIGCCLNPAGGSFRLFRFVWWLDCLLLKENASAFCSLRWLLEMFLAVAEFVGFRAGGRLPFEWLYWIFYCPLLAPLAPPTRITQKTKDNNGIVLNWIVRNEMQEEGGTTEPRQEGKRRSGLLSFAGELAESFSKTLRASASRSFFNCLYSIFFSSFNTLGRIFSNSFVVRPMSSSNFGSLVSCLNLLLAEASEPDACDRTALAVILSRRRSCFFCSLHLTSSSISFTVSFLRLRRGGVLELVFADQIIQITQKPNLRNPERQDGIEFSVKQPGESQLHWTKKKKNRERRDETTTK